MVNSNAGEMRGMRAVVQFWRGGLPLGRAFWFWGILGGGVVSLLTTVLALTLNTAGAPAWLAALVLAAFRLLNIPLGTAAGALIIWYLTQPQVRAEFA